MNPREAGFLLLTSQLGNPDRKVLTAAQLRSLDSMARRLDVTEPDRDLTARDLMQVGCSAELAHRIVALLSEEDLLQYYLQRGRKAGAIPMTRVSGGYPHRIREKLGPESSGCLWAMGDVDILKMPAVALVGSRELSADNEAFAREVGRQAALQGYALVSGNARGADRAAQDACLEAGGKVICVVADSLVSHRVRDNVLYLSEDGFDLPFSAQRAISRNRVIHSLGEKTFVAQSGYQTGGTWDGTVKNLRFNWSPVYMYRDGSAVAELLIQMGANAATIESLVDFRQLNVSNMTFFDQ